MSTEIQENPNWIKEAKAESMSLFAELDVLLKSLDRFFQPDNHPPSKQQISSRNLLPELEVVLDGIFRILTLIEVIMPESNRNAYWFQKFAESKLISGRKRDRMRAGMYKQDAPEKSFYVLYDTFINLKSLVTDIIRTQDIQFMSFKNLGDIISKELRENIHFNPFSVDINPDFDFIENKEITELVKNISDKELKKVISILLINLFRMLRYMKIMDHRSLHHISINCSLMIFTLLKSETDMFRSYISQSVRQLPESDLTMLLETLSYQFGMECKRVFHQELRNIYEKDSAVHQRGKVESARGILKNLTEQTVIQITKYWQPEIGGEDIFEVFITKVAQSLKLREDVYVLGRLVNEALKEKDVRRLSALLSMLLNYMEYFENFTFKLLRYDDFEEFDAMFRKVRSKYQEENAKELLEACHQFGVFLDTTLRQVEQRADLRNRDLDIDKAEEIVKQYLESS
jgi:hypothetical protein